MCAHRFMAVWLAAVLIFCIGCSGKNNPQLPSLNPTSLTQAEKYKSCFSNSHALWGFYEIQVDSSDGSVTPIPLRTAEFNANVVKFLQPPASPIHLLTIGVNPGTNFPEGYLDIDVTIRHPFPGMKKFRGFDVRGIVMGNGDKPIATGIDEVKVASGNDLRLLNPDGWTRWWNPTEFTSYGIILGYTQGAKATPGYLATATVNPYKYFADGLSSGGSLDEVILNQRGSFATSPGANTRRYILQFPISGGKPVFRFNYAVDASWALPDPAYSPDYPVEAFSAMANTQEAWRIKVDTSKSTIWYVDDAHFGGSMNLEVEVFDWQSLFNPNGVPDEISGIWVSTEWMPDWIDFASIAVPSPGTMCSSIWSGEISPAVFPSASGEFDLYIRVISKEPASYEPQIDGDSSLFDWPESGILTAYWFGKINVASTSGKAPIVTEVIPNWGEYSTVVTGAHIVGENFQNGATVEFRFDDSTVLNLSNVAWQNANLITCDIDCTGPAGFYDVKVTNPDLLEGSLEDGFEVIDKFECAGSAHDWIGEFQLNGVSYEPSFYRFDMAIMTQGTNKGKALYQMTNTIWGLIDPDGPAGQTVMPFLYTPNCYCVDIETCETTGRIAIISIFTDEKIWLYSSAGVNLGTFDGFPSADGNFAAIDFDKDGDLWAGVRTGPMSNQSLWVWELRHYKMLPSAPFYEEIIEDRTKINDLAMINPGYQDGIADLGCSFYLDRLFVFVANTADGGSNKITSWDISVSPPVKVGEIMNPFPPLTRHHNFSQGALSRMNIDVDHRFEDKYEQCRIYAYATIWSNSDPGLDCYTIRLDGDLNILDTGSIFHMGMPLDWDSIPQCAIINDGKTDAKPILFGCGWNGTDWDKWANPPDW